VFHVPVLPPLRGRVLTHDDRPVAEAVVSLHVDRGDSPDVDDESWRDAIDECETDLEGAFTLLPIGGAKMLRIHGAGLVSLVQPVYADGARSHIDVYVEAPRRLRGRIVVEGGFPSAPLAVLCHRPGWTAFNVPLGEWRSRDASGSQSNVSPDGDFVLTQIPRAECVLELVIVSAEWPLAQRTVPAGRDDLDVGDWILGTEWR